jgi:hypothetical protein
LQIWDKQVRNGHIKRITDQDIQSSVLEIMGTNVSTNHITCPADKNKTLGIKLPFLVMIIKNVSSLNAALERGEIVHTRLPCICLSHGWSARSWCLARPENCGLFIPPPRRPVPACVRVRYIQAHVVAIELTCWCADLDWQLKKYFTFEVQVLDDKNVRRRFRASNYQSTTRVKPFICTMPMRLDEGWNQIQFNLSDFTRRAYGTNYIETLRVQIHANCRIRRLVAPALIREQFIVHDTTRHATPESDGCFAHPPAGSTFLTGCTPRTSCRPNSSYSCLCRTNNVSQRDTGVFLSLWCRRAMVALRPWWSMWEHAGASLPC